MIATVAQTCPSRYPADSDDDHASWSGRYMTFMNTKVTRKGDS